MYLQALNFAPATNYEFYRIRQPQAGDWQVVVNAIDVPAQEPFTIQVLDSTPDVQFTVSSDKNQYVFPEKILIQAEVVAGVHVDGADVHAIVTRPDGSQIQFPLLDDGLIEHGDRFAGDGVYSNIFGDYTKDGAYIFDTIVNNQSGVTISNILVTDHFFGDVAPEPVPPFARQAQVSAIVSGVPLEEAPNLQPTEITFDPSTAVVGGTVLFDSGVRNTGDVDSDVFNIQWFVNNQEVGAAGSHAGVPAGQIVLDGNSQFSWTFDSPGTYSVTFTVDSDNQIEESNEEDNSTTIEVIVDFPPPPPPPPFPDLSCTELFGSAPEFVICEETETTCSFNARIDGGTCDQMCSSFGSTCVGAINNDESCEELPNNTDTCETPRDTEICICERPE